MYSNLKYVQQVKMCLPSLLWLPSTKMLITELGMYLGVEHLPSMCTALGSYSQYSKTSKK